MNESAMCPWSAFQPGTLSFCENRLCHWIAEPANTWSNIGYLLVGLYILWRARKDHAFELSAIGVIAIMVSVGSSLFHASGTFFGEVLDLFSMFLFATYMLCFNWWRIRKTNLEFLYWMFGIINALALLLLFLVNPIGIALFVCLIAAGFGLEAFLYRRDGKNINYRPLLYLVLCFIAAFACWRLDIRRVICNPDNHYVQGHSLWHLLNSFCFYFLYQFYRPFLMSVK